MPKSQDIEIIVKPSKKRGAHQGMKVCAVNGSELRKVGRGVKVCAVNGSELRKVEGLAQKNSRVEPGSILLFKIGYYSIYIL